MASQKRKRQDTDGLDLRPLKRTQGLLHIKGDNERPPDDSLDRRTPDQAQAMLLPGSFKASITQAATHGNLQDLPDLIYSESMSSPNTDLCRSQDVLHQEVHSERQWLRDLPEGLPHEYESPLPSEEALFSQYVRSRSPSCFSAQGVGGHHNIDGGMDSQIVAPIDTCLYAREEPHPAATPENIPANTNKPRITLRIRQPKPEPKPKVLLRLSQPKRTTAQRSVRQGVKDRRRRT